MSNDPLIKDKFDKKAAGILKYFFDYGYVLIQGPLIGAIFGRVLYEIREADGFFAGIFKSWYFIIPFVLIWIMRRGFLEHMREHHIDHERPDVLKTRMFMGEHVEVFETDKTRLYDKHLYVAFALFAIAWVMTAFPDG